MKHLTFLVKPASGHCDLRCGYCFYREHPSQAPERNTGIMSRETARAVIKAGAEAVGSGGMVHFTFQGGEPLLAGLDFYRDFLDMEKEFSGVIFSHGLQTNGTALREDWAELFRRGNFLIGLSVDGTPALHDRQRRDPTGQGSWQRVLAGLDILHKHGIPTQLLCVVTGDTARQPQKVYAGLKKTGCLGFQFIPCLEPEDARGATPWTLSPEAYGRFLCALFDCWYRDWQQGLRVSIRLFDDYLRLLLGQSPGSCAALGNCGSYLVVEADGSLYPCDFYVTQDRYLGNIHQMTPEQVFTCESFLRFQKEGKIRPRECGECRYFSLCRGGCRRDMTPTRSNYYCQSFRTFFSYALPRLLPIAQQLRKENHLRP